MKLRFLGAAREVTGSCHLVESGGLRFLVDCGLFQGGREAEAKNRRFPDFDPESIAFVLLTHAHIDHSGLLPRLINLGFKGRVYCTSATADLLGVMLPDAAHIQEKEAEWANYAIHKRRKRLSAAAERAPLYTVTQAQAALKRLERVGYDKPVRPHPRVRVVFRDAGHILGSSSLEIWLKTRVGATARERKLVFSGDLGMPARPLMNDPAPVSAADYLVVESTYGNRCHKTLAQTVEELVHAIHDTLVRKHGNVIIPAFAVGRTQEILYLLVDLYRQGRLPRHMGIFVDSPMATAATEITLKHSHMLDAEARELLAWGQGEGRSPLIRFTESVEESMALNKISEGAVILSASGMCEAGRIKHHLRFNLPRRESSVILSGFQAAGTLGRRLVDGARSVRLFREDVPVRADLYTLGGLSAHADREALLAWLACFDAPPRRTFVVHGEESTAESFADAIRILLGWSVEVPTPGSEHRLDD